MELDQEIPTILGDTPTEENSREKAEGAKYEQLAELFNNFGSLLLSF